MPYILPQPQVRQTGWDQAGFATGVIGDILLKALLAGQIGGRPSAGVFTSPTGATTNISPAERVKGAPNIRLADLISKQGQGSFLPTQYSGFQLQPDLSRQLQQAQLAKAPLEQQKLQSDIQNQQALSSYYNSLSNGGASGVALEKLQQLEDDALAGDEDAVAAYRKLKQLGIL